MSRFLELALASLILVVGCWIPEVSGSAVTGPGRDRYKARYEIKFNAKEPAVVSVFAEQNKGSPESGERLRVDVHDSQGKLIARGSSLPFDFGDHKAAMAVVYWTPTQVETYTIRVYSGETEGYDRGKNGNRAYISWN